MPNYRLSKEIILERVTQMAIWERYFGGGVSTKKLYKNPKRSDSSPGCRFYYSRSNILYFHDFSTGDMWNCFDWVQDEYNCTFYEALKIINQDFGLGLGFYRSSFPTNYQTKRTKIVEEPIEQDFKMPRWDLNTIEMDENDLKYWKQFGITENILDKFNVFKVKEATDGKVNIYSTDANPVYAYIFPKWDRLKLYRPLTTNKKYKWGGYCTKEVIQGYSQLPDFGDLLIITKSLKDVMTLEALGYTAIAPSGEGVLLTEEEIKELKYRFKEIVMLFDNDGGFTKKEGKGKYATLRYFRKYQIPYIFLEGAKDISDYVKEFGLVKARKHLKELLHEPKKTLPETLR